MATDNVTLNAGTGGSTLRTFGDTTGDQWPSAVLCYATTVSAGANVLQPVTPSEGLPVAQQGTWNVGITGSAAVTGTFWQTTQPVSIGASVAVTGTFWQTTQPVSGTLAATQSGAWTNTVTQATAANLNATVVGTGTFAVQAAQSGTWNVATVTAVTGITNALPSGTNLLGQVATGQQVAGLYNGTTAVTPQYAAITASSSGATTIVSAVAGKKVYILRWSLSSNGNVNVNWQSHTTTTTATGLHYLTQFASAGGAYCPAGIFATAIGEALDLNLSASVAVGGELTYVQF